eukprot:c56332_g1_i1 orf=3-206(+)
MNRMQNSLMTGTTPLMGQRQSGISALIGAIGGAALQARNVQPQYQQVDQVPMYQPDYTDAYPSDQPP